MASSSSTSTTSSQLIRSESFDESLETEFNIIDEKTKDVVFSLQMLAVEREPSQS